MWATSVRILFLCCLAGAFGQLTDLQKVAYVTYSYPFMQDILDDVYGSDLIVYVASEATGSYSYMDSNGVSVTEANIFGGGRSLIITDLIDWTDSKADSIEDWLETGKKTFISVHAPASLLGFSLDGSITYPILQGNTDKISTVPVGGYFVADGVPKIGFSAGTFGTSAQELITGRADSGTGSVLSLVEASGSRLIVGDLLNAEFAVPSIDSLLKPVFEYLAPNCGNGDSFCDQLDTTLDGCADCASTYSVVIGDADVVVTNFEPYVKVDGTFEGPVGSIEVTVLFEGGQEAVVSEDSLSGGSWSVLLDTPGVPATVTKVVVSYLDRQDSNPATTSKNFDVHVQGVSIVVPEEEDAFSLEQLDPIEVYGIATPGSDVTVTAYSSSSLNADTLVEAETTTTDAEGIFMVKLQNLAQDGSDAYWLQASAEYTFSDNDDTTELSQAVKITANRKLPVITITTPSDLTNPSTSYGGPTSSNPIGSLTSISGTGDTNSKVHTLTIKSGEVVYTPPTVISSTSGTWQFSNLDLTKLPDGTVEITVSTTNDDGNTGVAEASFEKDTVPPTVTLNSVDDDDDQVISESKLGTMTFSGSVDGSFNVKVSVYSSSDLDTPLYVSAATVPDGGSWSVAPNFDTQNPAVPSAIVIKACAEDDIKNLGCAQSEVITVDSGCAVSIDDVSVDNKINALEAEDLQVTGTADPGAMVTLKITGGTQSVDPSPLSLPSGVTKWSFNVDVSDLPFGTLTFAVSSSDPAGNTCQLQSDLDVEYDADGLTIKITTPTSVITTNQITVGGTAEEGAEITVSITDEKGTSITPVTTTAGSVEQSGTTTWTIPDINISSLTDGIIFIEADALEDGLSASTRVAVRLLREVPPPKIDTPIAGDGVINYAEYFESGGVTFTGVALPGATVTLNFAVRLTGSTNWISKATVTTTAGSNGEWQRTVDPGTLNNENLPKVTSARLTATQTISGITTRPADAAVEVFGVDVSKPSLTLTQGATPVNNADSKSYTVEGSGTVGLAIEILIAPSSGSNTQVISEYTPTSSPWSTDIDISSLPDGQLRVMATVSDDADNTASSSYTIEKRATLPTVTLGTISPDVFINSAELTSLTVSGTSSAPGTVVYTIDFKPTSYTSQSISTTGSASPYTWTDTQNFGSLSPNDGKITIKATFTDSYGNPASDSKTFFLDLSTFVSVDEITDDNKLNIPERDPVVITGTAEALSEISCYALQGAGDDLTAAEETVTSVTASADGSWTCTFTELDLLSDSTSVLFFRVDATDLAKNTDSETVEVAIDWINPVLTLTADDSQLTDDQVLVTFSGDLTDANVSPTTDIDIELTDGTTTLQVTTNPTSAGDDYTYSVQVNTASFANGKIDVKAMVVDDFGNTGEATTIIYKGIFVTIDAETSVGSVVSSGEFAFDLSGDYSVVSQVDVYFNDGTGTGSSLLGSASQTNGRWTYQVTTLDDGSYEFYAKGTFEPDTTVESDTITIKVDTKAEDLQFTYPEPNQRIGKAEATALTISGTSEPSSTIALTIADSNGNAITFSATDGSDLAAIKSDALGRWKVIVDLSTQENGDYTLQATETDVYGNVATAPKTRDIKLEVKSTPVTIDTPNLTPTGVINSQAATQGVTITGTAAANEDVTVTFEANNDGFVIQRTVTATAGGTWSVPNVKLVSLDDGNINVIATQSDDLDNVETSATLTLKKSTTIPSISISAISDDGFANQQEVEAGFAIKGSTSADQVSLVLSSPSLTANISPTVSVDTDANTWTASLSQSDFSFSDSSTKQAQITVTAVATDSTNGNSKTTQTTFVYDVEAQITINVISVDDMINPIEAANLQVTGTSEPGTTSVSVNVKKQGGGSLATELAVVGANGDWTVTFSLDLDDEQETTLDFVATSTDAAGNTGVSSTRTVTYDPTGIALTIDQVLSGPESANVVTTSDEDDFQVTGTVKAGSTVVVTIEDTQGNSKEATAIVDDNGDWTASVDVNTLLDGPLFIEADADFQGHTDSTSKYVRKDTSVEKVTIDAEPTITGATDLNQYTVSGSGEPKATVTIDVYGPDGVTSVASQQTAPVDDAGEWTTKVDLSSLETSRPEFIIVSATQVDQYENGPSDTQTRNIDVDLSLPVVTITTPQTTNPLTLYSASESRSVVITGTVEGTDSLPTITISGTANRHVSTTASSSGGTGWTATLNTLGLADGELTISASVSDDEDNQAEIDSVKIKKDSLDPTVSINDPQATDDIISLTESSSYQVTGSVSEESTITIVITDKNKKTMGATSTGIENGAWSLQPTQRAGSQDVSSISELADGPLVITATAEDIAGNTASTTYTVELDLTTTPVVITSPLATETINQAESSAVKVTGTAEAGHKVTVTATNAAASASDQEEATADEDGNFSVVFDLSDRGEWTEAVTSVTFQAVATDNINTPVTSEEVTVTFDVVAPVVLNTAGNGPWVPLEDFVVNEDAVENVVIEGSVEGLTAGESVLISIKDSNNRQLSFPATLDGSLQFSVQVSFLSFAEGSIDITVRATDAAGNTNTDENAIHTVRKDIKIPTLTINPVSDGYVNKDEIADGITISGSTSADTVSIRIDSPLSNGFTLTAQVTGTAWTASFTQQDLEDSLASPSTTRAEFTVVAEATDSTNDNSITAETTFVYDVEAQVAINDISVDNKINRLEAANLQVTGTSEPGTKSVSVTVNQQGESPRTVEALVAADGDWTTTFQLNLDDEQQTTLVFVATSEDAAGNTGTSSSLNVEYDPTGINLTIDALLSDPQNYNVITQANENTFEVAGDVKPGSTVQVTIEDTQGNSKEATATVNVNGEWTATVDVNTLLDGPLFIEADADFQGHTDSTSKYVRKDTSAEELTIDAEPTITGSTDLNPFTLSGSGEPDATVTVDVYEEGGATRVGSQQSELVNADGEWTVTVDLSSLETNRPSFITVSADQTDKYGNQRTAPVTRTITVDLDLPTVTIVSPETTDPLTLYSAEQSKAVVVTGTTTGTNSLPVITISDDDRRVSTTATPTQNGWMATLNILSLSEGELTISAVVSDDEDNQAITDTEQIEKDSMAPTIAIKNPQAEDNIINLAESSTYEVTGTVIEVSTITIVITDKNGNTMGATSTDETNDWSLQPTQRDANDVNSISDLVDGPLLITATAEDAAGNTASTTYTVELDLTTSPVVITSPSSTDTINQDESSAVQVSGTAEPGSAVTVTATNNANADSQSEEATADEAGKFSVTFDLSGWSADVSLVNFVAEADDSINSPVTSQTVSVAFDIVAPVVQDLAGNGPWVPAENFVINEEAVANVVIEGSVEGLSVGDSVVITIKDTAERRLTLSSELDNNLQFREEVSFLSFAEGDIEITVRATDAAGNSNSDDNAIHTGTKDVTSPTLQIINVNAEGWPEDPVIDSALINDFFIVVSAPDASKVIVEFRDAQLAEFGPLQATYIAAQDRWELRNVDLREGGTGINVSEGNLQVTISALDEFDNTMEDKTIVALVDTVAVDLEIRSPTASRIYNQETSQNVVVSGFGEPGATVSLTFQEIEGDSPSALAGLYEYLVDSRGDWMSDPINLSSLNGTVRITASQVDQYDNTGENDSVDIILDALVGDVNIEYPFTKVLINAEKAEDFYIEGTSEPGARLVVRMSDTDLTTERRTQANAAGEWTILNVDISMFPDGDIQVTAQHLDDNDNVAPASVTFEKRTTLPVVRDLIVNGGDQFVSFTEGQQMVVSGIIDIEDIAIDDTVSVVVFLYDSEDNFRREEVDIESSGAWQVQFDDLDLALTDGVIRVQATARDAFNNDSEIAKATFILDTQAPVPTIDRPIAGNNILNINKFDDTVIVTGDAEPMSTLTVRAESVNGQVLSTAVPTIDLAGNWRAELDTSAFPQGSVNIVVVETDRAGNQGSPVTATIAVDTVAPALSITEPSEDDRIFNAEAVRNVRISGKAEGRSDVNLVISDGTTKIVQTVEAFASGDWFTSVDLSNMRDGPISIEASNQDAAGNSETVEVTITKESSTAVVDISTPISGDGVVTANEAKSVRISGRTDESDGEVQITVTDSTNRQSKMTVQANDFGEWSHVFDLSNMQDGVLTITATTTNSFGNTATDTAFATIYTRAWVEISSTIAGDNFVSGSEVSSVRISGTGEADRPVRVEVSDGATVVVAETRTTGDQKWEVFVNLSDLSDGALTITATLENAADNIARATNQITKDTTEPTLTIINPTPGTVVNSQIQGSLLISGNSNAQSGQVTVEVSDGELTLSGAATVSGGQWQLSMSVSNLQDGTLSIVARMSDAVGNVARASTSVTKTTSTPSLQLNTPLAGDNVVSEGETLTLTGQATEGSTVNAFILNSNGDVVQSASTQAGSVAARALLADNVVPWTITMDVSNLPDGFYTVKIEEIDSEGNTDEVTQSIRVDTIEMFVTIDPLAPEVAIYDVANTFISGDATPRSLVVLTIRDYLDNQLILTVQADSQGYWSLNADLSTLEDGPLTVSAMVDDNNGHVAVSMPRAIHMNRTPVSTVEVPVPFPVRVTTPVPTPVIRVVVTPVPTPVRIYVFEDADEDSATGMTISLLVTFLALLFTLF